MTMTLFCVQCGGEKPGHDGLCQRCRARGLAQTNRRYVFTEELRDDLRDAYAGGYQHLTAGLDRLVRRTGWPRFAFIREARRLEIGSVGTRWAWTPEEDAYLAEHAGVQPMDEIAKALGRSRRSVWMRSQRRLRTSMRVSEGYTVQDLAEAMSISWKGMHALFERGYFGRVKNIQGHRVSEKAVVKFLVEHPDKYDLRRVDQGWFKAVLFGGGARGCDYVRTVQGGQNARTE